jgi:hypothetical protein
MKRYITILLVCFGFLAGIAQNGGGKEKIKKLKIAYFTENLNFTPEEAQHFWPIYNALDDKNHEFRVKGFNKIKRELKNIDSMSDAEATKLLARLQSLEKQVYDNSLNLTEKLKGFLPAKKIILLKKAERDFNRKLMKQFRDKRRKQ